MNMAMEQESYEVDSSVRRFHIYKDCWVPTIGEACPSHLTMILFSTILFTTIVFLVDRDEICLKLVFSSSPLTLKNWEMSPY